MYFLLQERLIFGLMTVLKYFEHFRPLSGARICYNQLVFRRSSRINVVLNTTTNYFSPANIYLKRN